MSTVITKNLQIGADGTASNNFTVYQPASPDGTLRIGNGNSGTTSAQVVLTSAGDVGIGTSTPATRLDVSGGTTSIRGAALFNTSSTAGTGSSAYIRSTNAFSSATTPDYSWWFNDQCGIFHPASDVIGFSTVGAERMRIDSSGNVGIGTSSPGAKLDVGTSANAYNSIRIAANSNGTYAELFSNSATPATGLYAVTNHPLLFGTNNTERARIDSTGNLLLTNTSQYYGTNQFTNKKYMVFNYPLTGFGAYNDCTDFSTPGNGSALVQMRISQGGSVGCRGSFSGGQTLNDYAEYFEWSDGNPDNQDRIGVTVVLDGDKIRPSTEQDSGEDIVGVVSGTAGVVLGSSPFEWAGKYQKDEFGRIVTEKVTWVHWTEGDTNNNYKVGEVPDGVVVPADADYKTYDNPVVVENYDESAEYQSRDQRKEWAPIGLVGQVHVKNGQLVGTRWRKMKDVSANVALWLIR